MADFNDFIGFDKLLGVHLNDSKGKLITNFLFFLGNNIKHYIKLT